MWEHLLFNSTFYIYFFSNRKTLSLNNALKSKESKKRPPRIVQWEFSGKVPHTGDIKLTKRINGKNLRKHSHVYKINPLPPEEFNKLEEQIRQQQQESNALSLNEQQSDSNMNGTFRLDYLIR